MGSRLVLATFVGVLTLVTACVTGCSAESGDVESVSSYESEIKLSGIRYLGRIVDGQTRTGHYSASPPYRSYAFDAKGGDQITIDVRSEWGDALAWITDSKYRVLAFNDDAPGHEMGDDTLDAHVTYTVPATEPTRSYRIVFRDYDLLEALFDVSLAIESAQPVTCTHGEQPYAVGDTFEAGDGCNTCACGEDGEVTCTKEACVCDPAKETNRAYFGTPQDCATIRFSCPEGQVQFSNDCGCGCESPPAPN